MKKLVQLSLFLLLNYNFSSSAQCLSGTYTIDPNSGDYHTFTDAVADLVSNGVCGPVEFLVKDASYTEYFTIPSIAGASDTSRITFKANPTNVNQPILGALNQYLILLDSACYITFDNIWLNLNAVAVSPPNYSATILLDHGASHNIIRNCTLYSTIFIWSPSNFQYLSSLNDNELSGCIVLLGDLKMIGDLINFPSENLRILNNYFGESSAILLSGIGNYQITGNTFENVIPQNSNPAISAVSCDHGGTISGNKMQGDGTTGIDIENNTNDSLQPLLISNNFISCGGNLAGSISAIKIVNSHHIKVYNNNVGIYNGLSTTFDAALYLQASTYIDIKNNIFYNSAGNYVMYVINALSDIQCDYNDLFSTGSALLKFNGVQYANLAAWQAATPQRDQHSFSVDPIYLNANDLHVNHPSLKNSAVALPEITNDIDLEPRNANPDIGADEFSNVTDSVWPGDSNNDGIADATDLIPIGIYFGITGNSRSTISTAWMPYASSPWYLHANNFMDAKFADCNGDGTINLDDTLALTNNSGLTHPLRPLLPSLQSKQQIHVSYSTDTINSGSYADVFIRKENLNSGFADSIYVMQINGDLSAPVVANTLSFNKLLTSWGTYASNYLTAASVHSNQLSLAITGIDHQLKPADSLLLQIRFQLINNTGQGFWYTLPFTQPIVYDTAGNEIPYQLISDSIFITNITGINSVASTPEKIYLRNRNTLNFLADADYFQLMDISGRVLLERKNIHTGEEISLPINTDQLYLLLTKKNGHLYREKMMPSSRN